jgi:hypothetical protein
MLGKKTAKEIWNKGLKELYDMAIDGGAQVMGMVPLPTNLVPRCAAPRGKLPLEVFAVGVRCR